MVFGDLNRKKLQYVLAKMVRPGAIDFLFRVRRYTFFTIPEKKSKGLEKGKVSNFPLEKKVRLKRSAPKAPAPQEKR